jgi:hypothetical protein
MKPASAKPVPGHHRCFHHSAAGRQCRSWVIDPRGMFCRRHCAAQPNGPEDFALQLLQRSCNFQNAQGIHDSVQSLYTLLAADAISPRRAAVLGYLASLLIRTLPAIHNDPYPQAGTPMSATQLAEREKAKVQVASPSKSPAPALTQKSTPAQKTLPAQQSTPGVNPGSAHKPVSADKAALPNKIVAQRSAQPSLRPPVHPAPQTSVAATGDDLPRGPGRPMPATRAEFAAQVLKSIATTPLTPNPTPTISAKPNPPAMNPSVINPTVINPSSINQSRTPLRSPAVPPPANTTTEPASATPSELINQPAEKERYRYQIRLHENMHVTGSEPQWGWTTDP